MATGSSLWGWGGLLALVALPAMAWLGACGSDALDSPSVANGGPTTNTISSCATPQLGCDCETKGQVVDCGKEVRDSASFLYCYEGHRTCDATGHWGDCLDGSVHALAKELPGELHGLTMGSQIVCPTGTDPCDPYCNLISDDPIGLMPPTGFVVLPAGLTVAGGVPMGPGSLQTTNTGDSTCGGAVNVHTSPCSTAGVIDQSKCQQDWRCDVPSNTCVWNGAAGYFDPTAGGIDLTIGAGCDFTALEVIPLCNRGSAAVPANTIIGVNITNAVEDGCTAVHPVADCVVNVGAGGLPPGQCTNVSGCPISGNKNAVVNASGRDIAEAAGRCKNNASAVKDTGSPGCAACVSCQTTITGKVFDPSGATPTANANDTPLANIQIFQPAGALTTFTDNPAAGPPPCDTCASLSSPSTTSSVSAPDGTFSLFNVTPGPNQNLVVQTGRWRRQFAIGNVTACSTTALTNGTARLPKSRTDGLGSFADIPKTAISFGNQESLECLLRRIGIADTEFAPGTATTNPQRFHMFRSNGMQTSSASPSVPVLYNAGGSMGAYTAVIGNCDQSTGVWETTSAADRTRIKAYADAGGHLFLDHWLGDALIKFGPAPWNGATVATWDGPAAGGTPTKAKVDNTSGPQTTFFNWMSANNAMVTYGSPFVPLTQPRMQAFSAGPASVEFIRGLDTWTSPAPDEWTSTPGGNHAMSMSFDTPTTAAPGAQCGRVVFNSMHVSQTRAPFPSAATDIFPNKCTGYPAPGGALTPEELALEYQLFQLTACALTPPSPPPPPPPPTLPASITFQADFTAMCPTGTRVQWQLFEWQSIVPLPTTSIDFRAATNDNAGLLPTSPTAPGTVSAGKATTTTGPTWTFDTGPGPSFTPLPVSYHLTNDPPGPPQVSGNNLRVFMTFNTNLVVAPTLVAWRQLFDCAPAE